MQISMWIYTHPLPLKMKIRKQQAKDRRNLYRICNESRIKCLHGLKIVKIYKNQGKKHDENSNKSGRIHILPSSEN